MNPIPSVAARHRLGPGHGGSCRGRAFGLGLAVAVAGFGFLAALLNPIPAAAHGELHQQLIEVSAQLVEHPDDFDLLLRRGELHRLHGSLPESRSDFERARKLRPDDLEPGFRLGRLELDAENPSAAARWLEATLARKPHHIEAALLLARSLVKLNRPAESIEHFNTAIHWSRQPRPEWFLERSRAILATTQDPKDREALKRATASLDEGLELIGPVPTLHLAAVELDLRGGYHDVALRRIAALRATSERKETWWFRSGLILEDARRPAEAIQAFEAALKALESLPDRQQRTLAMTQLRQDIDTHLARLRRSDGDTSASNSSSPSPSPSSPPSSPAPQPKLP